jgi:hypothetical protein
VYLNHSRPVESVREADGKELDASCIALGGEQRRASGYRATSAISSRRAQRPAAGPTLVGLCVPPSLRLARKGLPPVARFLRGQG